MSKHRPKISIVTATYNNAATLKDTLASVAAQDYPNIEHLIIDGLSKDNTGEVVKAFPHVAEYISEKDTGMYNAINKGIKLSTGDFVGILNSDDVFSDTTILSQVVSTFEATKAEAIYGDVKYVSQDLAKTVRYYSSAHFKPHKFKIGHMPAHPTYYTSKDSFEKYGYYKEDYQIAADFELLVRQLYKNKLPVHYLNLCMVDMRTGGMSNSSFKNRLTVNKEMVRACRENGIETNLFNMSKKLMHKLSEYVLPSHR